MTALWILLILAAVFWLLGRIRLGGWVQYDEDGLLAKVIAGPVKLTVFPQKQLTETEKKKRKIKEEKKKAKKDAKKAREAAKKAKKRDRIGKEPPDEKAAEKKGGFLPPILDLLPLVGEAAGGLKKRIRIDELTIHITWASPDPAETAMGYGRANAVVGMIWPLIDHNFNVKKREVRVAVDFTQDRPAIFCRAALTMRLGQLTGFGLRLAFKFLGIMIRSRRKRSSAKKQEA